MAPALGSLRGVAVPSTQWSTGGPSVPRRGVMVYGFEALHLVGVSSSFPQPERSPDPNRSEHKNEDCFQDLWRVRAAV